MRVLLDENLDRRLKRFFDTEFEVVTVPERGWSGKKNGVLPRAAEAEFDALVTMDQNIEHQQNLRTIRIGIVVISARSNRRQDVEPAMPAINAALRTAPARRSRPCDGVTTQRCLAWSRGKGTLCG